MTKASDTSSATRIKPGRVEYASSPGDPVEAPSRRLTRFILLTITAGVLGTIPLLIPGNYASTVIAFICFYTLGTLGLQLLAVDRPGLGRYSPHPSKTMH